MAVIVIALSPLPPDVIQNVSAVLGEPVRPVIIPVSQKKKQTGKLKEVLKEAFDEFLPENLPRKILYAPPPNPVLAILAYEEIKERLNDRPKLLNLTGTKKAFSGIY